jgi:SecD/SecF fusion protein
MKSSPLKIILSLTTVGALVLFGGAIWVIKKYYPFKPSIERDGGTILVYELDEETLPAGYQPTEMAEAIRRRVDPTKTQNVSVRPDGDKRMEVRIPGGEGHEDRVEQIKEMLGVVGNLEFRILANEEDDEVAIEAAKQFFAESNNDPIMRDELNQRNMAGQPPGLPAPEKNGFLAKKGLFTYSWFEMGYRYRADLGFENVLTPQSEQANGARKDNKPFQVVGGGPLIYSREVATKRRETGEKKTYEYFVLARDLEEGMDNPGKYVDKASEGPNLEIYFHLADQGGDLMRDLTSRNIGRQMAVILDGQVMSSANIHDKIGNDGQITGQFTKDQVARMVTILREGCLPAKLKPRPVSEIEFEPPKNR